MSGSYHESPWTGCCVTDDSVQRDTGTEVGTGVNLHAGVLATDLGKKML